MTKKKVGVWGAGASARQLVTELPSSEEIVAVFESNPKQSSAFGREIFGLDKLDCSVEKLYVASMFYPQIIELVEGVGYPLNQVEVAVAHRDDPRYGTMRLEAMTIFEDLPKYLAHQKTIEEISAVVERSGPKIFGTREAHLRYALDTAPKTGMVLEFGVYRGESLLILARNTNRAVWGFDSFAGFSSGSGWDTIANRAVRKQVGFPDELNDYRYLVDGFFEESLEPWLLEHQEPIAYIHYDAGELSTARFVFNALKDKIMPGGLITFDEFVPSPSELDVAEYTVFSELLGEYVPISRCGDSVTIQRLDVI